MKKKTRVIYRTSKGGKDQNSNARCAFGSYGFIPQSVTPQLVAFRGQANAASKNKTETRTTATTGSTLK